MPAVATGSAAARVYSIKDGTTWDSAHIAASSRAVPGEVRGEDAARTRSAKDGTTWGSSRIAASNRAVAEERAAGGSSGYSASFPAAPPVPGESRGADAARVRPLYSGTTWGADKAWASVRVDAHFGAERAGAATLENARKIYPLPQQRYGRPDAFKGAILALDPNDHSQGDALYFSRYPTDLTERIEAILASESTPGRAYPAFQQMGANGISLSTELWFCDAFMWRRGAGAGPGPAESALRMERAGALPTLTSLDAGPVLVEKNLAALAMVCRQFFEFYMAGHDGTGVALPPADLYLHWGGAPRPIPIVIRRVDMKMEDFTSTPEGPRAGYKPGGEPQTVTAKVDFEVNIPLRVIDPFKPRRPDPRPVGRPKRGGCVTPGQLADGRFILTGQSAGSLLPLSPGRAEDQERRMRNRLLSQAIAPQ